ncbi:MAG TPA: hypothetical protein VKR06_23745 [Ktedonosporobacter sp.]|nr:hypothetical protein [Ktedonosporobacter sp.]
MQCTKCGFTIAPGQGFCNNCGTPVAASRPSYDPTVLAPQPGSNPGYNQGPPSYNPGPQPGSTPGYDPTILAPSSGSGTPPPPASYGAPQSTDPYASPPASPYSPPPASPYAPPAMGQYAPTPGPYAPQSPGVPYAPAPGFSVPPPKKSNKTLWIVLSVVLGVLVVVCGSCSVFLLRQNNGNNAQATTTATSSNLSSSGTTPAATSSTSSTNNGSAPTSSDVDPAAQAVITNLKTASSFNASTGAAPPASTFTSGQTVYTVFDVAKGASGYFKSKWYIDGQLEHDGNIYPASTNNGEFSISLPISTTGAGVVGIYYCMQSDCSDAKLAQVATFTMQ